jgi:hypothetical protein
MGENTNKKGGMGLGMVLFIIFMVLKLTNNIDWSWWWVTCPLWIPILIGILIISILAIKNKI